MFSVSEMTWKIIFSFNVTFIQSGFFKDMIDYFEYIYFSTLMISLKSNEATCEM